MAQPLCGCKRSSLQSRFDFLLSPLDASLLTSRSRDLTARFASERVALADRSVQGYRLLPRRDALTARHHRPAHATDRIAQTRIALSRWRWYIYISSLSLAFPSLRAAGSTPTYVYPQILPPAPSLSLFICPPPPPPSCFCCLLTDYSVIFLVTTFK